MLKTKNKKACPHCYVKRCKRGFTLLELIISMFIFVILMLATTTIFSGFFSGYQKAKITQKDLESAQFAMNNIAKILRTSSIIDPISAGNTSDLVSYDYSQGKCIEFNFDNSLGTYAMRADSNLTPDDPDPNKICSKQNIHNTTTEETVIGEDHFVDGYFSVTPSNDGSDGNTKKIGKVTISMQICPQESGANACSTKTSDKVNIQTSVSLRDYSKAGLY